MPTIPDSTIGFLSGLTSVIMVDPPSSGYKRLVKHLTVSNFMSGVDLQIIRKQSNIAASGVINITMASGDSLTIGEEDFYVCKNTGSVTSWVEARLLQDISPLQQPTFLADWVDIL